RERLGLLECRSILIIDAEVKRVVPHHGEHEAVAEHAGLAEHAAHGDGAERRELLAQEFGKAFAGNHPQSHKEVCVRGFADYTVTSEWPPACWSSRRHLFRKAFHIVGNDDVRRVRLAYALQVFQTAS